ncbi:vgr related protein [Sphingomonas baiyangensis]|uniref:Vgr related protein n=1 Tax=Sphingomonas baiyangensis TaxID=2572576 RepID=A0A4V5PU07_9SPHN|nr:vgr related protein [Sphingomonas baiyangensis]TKD52158.1 vgr related protein [Sphingomonas baiyangensis]
MTAASSNHARALTDLEIAMARSVFGDAIDYAAVRLVNRKWAFFQPRKVTMAPRGNIHFHPRGDAYCVCFASNSRYWQGHLIHELVHVWQHQRGVNLVLKRHPFCRYSYTIKPGWTLDRYGIEQQAEIVRHTFLLRQGTTVPGAPPLPTLESILPFGRP